MPDILHLLDIRAARARAFEALTSVDGVRHWWTRDSTLENRVGGSGEFAFNQRRVVTRVRVDEQAPDARVGWTVTASNAPSGWAGTTISFELRADGADTTLLFAHRGFREANDGYARVTTGWAYYLVSLKQYLETGTGAPHPEIDFANMLRTA